MGPGPSCPACASSETVRLGKLPDSNLFAGVFLDHILDGGSLYRCRGCLLKFRHPTENPADYDALYDNQGTLAWPTAERRPDWDRVVRHIAEHTPTGRVLDFGCYTGGLLARLDDAYECYGLEVNRAAAVEASRVSGNTTFASIDEIPAELKFDIVVACDVIEHMTNPMQTMAQLTSLLADDGVLILTTGDGENRLWNRFGANWWYCFFPEHISFISKPWLDHNARDLGLSLLSCETFGYCELQPAARPVHVVLTYFYGWFPKLYLALRRSWDRLRGKQGTTSVTGVGVSDDHLFVVLGLAAE